jgi:hypothetical protein
VQRRRARIEGRARADDGAVLTVAALSAPRRGRRCLWVWPIAVVLTLAAQWPWLNLHDDVRFTVGPLRAAWESHGPLNTFVHRPMANRLVMAGLDAITAGPVPLREKITLAWAMLAVAAAAAALQLALVRRATSMVASGVALAVFGSLAWASEAYVLQPEWTATVLAVLALALAMLSLPRADSGAHRSVAHRWMPRLLFGTAAVLLAVAVLQKYTTVTAALLALVVLFAVDRRCAVLLAASSGALTVALLLVSFAVGRHEWQWFTETSRLNPTAGLRWDAFGEWAVNWAWNNPVLLAWPAAAALAARLTGRRLWIWGSVAGFGVVLAVIVLQNQFFGYHGTPLLPAAAAVAGFAATRWTERFGSVLLGLAPLFVWVAVSWVVLRGPVAWRFGYRYAMAGWLLLVLVVVALSVWGQAAARSGTELVPRDGAAADRTRPMAPWAVLATVVLVAVPVTFPGWPATPYGFFGQNRSRRSEVERQTELIVDGQRVGEVVGDASVAYLADGETVYVVGNRTDCAYPGAVMLYRSNVASVSGLKSFADNLACLSAPAARHLVLQTWRVPFAEVDSRIAEAVAREYDCGRGTAVRELVVCPRR